MAGEGGGDGGEHGQVQFYITNSYFMNIIVFDLLQVTVNIS